MARRVETFLARGLLIFVTKFWTSACSGRTWSELGEGVGDGCPLHQYASVRSLPPTAHCCLYAIFSPHGHPPHVLNTDTDHIFVAVSVPGREP